MIFLYVIGRLLGLTSGAVALSAAKGGMLHRKSGMIFVYAMLLMSTSGARKAGEQVVRSCNLSKWIVVHYSKVSEDKLRGNL